MQARTAYTIDHIHMDSDKNITLFENYKCDSSLIQRKGKDSPINARSRQLISASCRILYGRPMGDLLDTNTCFQPFESSALNFVLASEKLLPNFTYFNTTNFYLIFQIIVRSNAC